MQPTRTRKTRFRSALWMMVSMLGCASAAEPTQRAPVVVRGVPVGALAPLVAAPKQTTPAQALLDECEEATTKDERVEICGRPRWVDATSFDCHNGDMSDLCPLQRFVNVERVYFNDARVGDLGPLAKLPKLTQLTINRAQLSDLSPLAKIPGLTWLDLRSTRVSNLGPLAGLGNLRTLFLSNT